MGSMRFYGTIKEQDTEADVITKVDAHFFKGLGCIYIKVKAKAIFFFDLLPLTHRCSINTQIGNNATYSEAMSLSRSLSL